MRFFRDLKISKKILLSMVGLLFVVIVGQIVTASFVSQVEEADAVAERQAEIGNAIERLASLQNIQNSAIQNFLITGNRQNVADFKKKCGRV